MSFLIIKKFICIAWNTFPTEFSLKEYKIQLTQELKPIEHLLHRNCLDRALKQLLCF